MRDRTETFDSMVGGRDTVAALTLDLIRSGGPIKTDELLREVATLRNEGGVSAEYTADLVVKSIAFHAGKGRIRETSDGWDYVPPAGEPQRPPKPRERQASFDFGGVR